MKKTISVLLTVLLLLSLTTTCGGSRETVKAPQPEEVKYYISEYTMEFGLHGGMVQRTAYTYDDQWRMTSWVSSVDGADNEAIDTRVNFTYSDDNTVLTMTEEGSSTVAEFRRTFDENGNIIKAEEYEDGVLVNVTESQYDGENRLLSSIITYPDHEYYVSIKQHNTYDSSGNLTTEEYETTLTEGTTYTSRTETTYDEQGRKLTQTQFTDGVQDALYEYTYDGSTQTRTSTGPDGTSEGTLVFTYDEHGNQLTQEAYDADGSLHYRQVYSYIGTDGSTSSGIQE